METAELPFVFLSLLSITPCFVPGWEWSQWAESIDAFSQCYCGKLPSLNTNRTACLSFSFSSTTGASRSVPVGKVTRLKCPLQNCVSFLFIFVWEMIPLLPISPSSVKISRCGELQNWFSTSLSNDSGLGVGIHHLDRRDNSCSCWFSSVCLVVAILDQLSSAGLCH